MICLKQFPKDYLFNFCSAAAMWRRSRLKFSFSKENLLEMSVGSSIFLFALIWLGKYAKKQERENNLILENVTRGKWNGLMTWLFGIRFILDHLFRTRNIYEISSVIIGNLIFWIPSLLNDWHGCCTTTQWRSCCKTNRASPLNAFLEDIQQNNKKVKIKWDKRRKYARWLVHFMDHIFGSDQKYKSWWCIKYSGSREHENANTNGTKSRPRLEM